VVFGAVTLPDSSKSVINTVDVPSNSIAGTAVEARLKTLHQGPVFIRRYLGLFKHLAKGCVPILELLHYIVPFGAP
jgi:hypothetical protein